MRNFYNSKALAVLGMGLTLLFSNQANAQCSIVGLEETYCIDSDPVILTGDPGGGAFAGPGVTDGIFYPEDAGVGIHTLEYTFFSGADRYYIKSNIGNPWGSTSTNASMDAAFGPGDWILESFETADPATVFSTTGTSMIFLDGSEFQATELNTFVTANLALIEDWVFNGGVICINAAPNEGGTINCGFGGTSLSYSTGAGPWTGPANAVDPGFEAFLGPVLPTSTSMSGTSYGHGEVVGTGLTDILTGDGNVLLAEKTWGAGLVLFGTMTTTNWHSPSPQGNNFRTNLFVYMDEYVESGVACVVTEDVEVLDEEKPDITATADPIELCLGEGYTLTGEGEAGVSFDWGATVEDGETIFPDAAGTYTHLLTAVSASGCIGTSLVSVMVNPVPVVDAGLDVTQCIDMDVTLNGDGAVSYEWDGGVSDGVAFDAVEGETTYTVTGTDENGCTDDDEVIVTGVGIPAITGVISDEYAAFGASIDVTVTGGSGPFGYTWEHGPTTEDVSGLEAGSYTVHVDDVGVEDGICPEVSETFIVTSFIGVEELNTDNLVVYPTPTTDFVTVALPGQFDYELTAINGDVIARGTAVDQETLNVEELAAGTYLIKVTVEGQTATTKVVKQ